MSFYGNLSDRSRTDLKFDKIYPNRFMMDNSAATDSVYVGRYVLINYEDGYNNILLDNYFDNFYCLEFEKGHYTFWEDFDVYVNDGQGFYLKPEGKKELERPRVEETDKEDLEFFERSVAFKVKNEKHLYNFNLEDIYVKFEIKEDGSFEYIKKVTQDEYEKFWQNNNIEEIRKPILKVVKKIDDTYALEIIEPIFEETPTEETPTEETPTEETPTEETPTEETPVDIYNRKNENGKTISILKVYKYHYYEVGKDEYVFIWPYDGNEESQIYCAGTVPSILEPRDGDYFTSENGKINFRIDEAVYKTTARGYHSTVWEKVYINDKYKYIKIAELNTYVPTINLKANAPTDSPKTPHFAPYGDNINYELDWQPSWGFRIKSADPNLKLRKFDENGIKEGSSVLASQNNISNEWVFPNGEIKSDVDTKWTTQFFDEKTRTYKKYQLEKNGTNPREWKELTSNTNENDALTPAAIYFNKAGFDRDKSTYSSGTNTPLKKETVKNYISIEPSGRSGRIYSDNFEQDAASDTQELSVMLPVLGDTVAEMWDLIYGNDVNSGIRNTDITWKEATFFDPIRKGLRMVGEEVGYQKKDLSTLAGCINTAHDLIGMIVADSKNIDLSKLDDINLKEYSEYFIYYNPQDQMYYQKQPYTYLTPIENNDIITNSEDIFTALEFKADKDTLFFHNLTNNNNDDDNNETREKYYFKEFSKSSTVKYDYVLSSDFYPDKEYVKFEDGALTPLTPLTYYDKELNPFFRKDEETSPVPNFIQTKGETFRSNSKYYNINFEEFTQEEDGAIKAPYFPKKYYYGIPIYKNGEEIGMNFYEDYSKNGINPYPLTKDAFVNKYGGEEKDIPEEYFDKYVNAPYVKYYLPKPIEGSSQVQYTQVQTYKELGTNYNKEEHFHLLGDSLYIKNVNGGYDLLTSESAALKADKIYVKETEIIDQYLIEIDHTKYYHTYPYVVNRYYYVKDSMKNEFHHLPEASAEAYYRYGNIDGVPAEEITIYKKVGDEQLVKNLYTKDNFPPCYREVTDLYDQPGSYKGYEYSPEDFNPNDLYYFIDENKLKPINIFEENTYYKKITETDENGKVTEKYEIIENSSDLQDVTIIYRQEKDIRVYEPYQGLKTGDIWNINVNPPEGIHLGYAIKGYKMAPLYGFARNMNTMLGLIVKINTLINDNNIYSRDRKTIQGTLNYLNDIINKIDELYPNELVFTDQFGRIYAPKDSVSGDDKILVQIKNNQLSISHKEPQEDKDLESTSLDPITLSNFQLVEDPDDAENKTEKELKDEGYVRYIDDNGEYYYGKILDCISFKVPIYYFDSTGHIYKELYQEYKIPNAALAEEALENLRERVSDLERNALRMYKEGVVYNNHEATDSSVEIDYAAALEEAKESMEEVDEGGIE